MNDARKHGVTVESCQLWTNSSGSSPPTATGCRKALESMRRPKCIKRVSIPTGTEKPTLATANHSCRQAQVSSGTFWDLLHLAMSSRTIYRNDLLQICRSRTSQPADRVPPDPSPVLKECGGTILKAHGDVWETCD